MYKQLTTEHSLYCLTEDKFNLFLTTTEMHPIEGYISTARSLNSLDSHATVLHIWCMLNEAELKLVLNPDKMMPYSIDYYILNLLRSDKKIKQFVQSRTMDQGRKFVLAYYLACATLQWGDTIILEHEKGQHLCETNQQRNYFLLSDEENITHLENHDLYLFQKAIINIMVADFGKTDRFNQYIDEALQLTRVYLYNVH